MLIYSKRNILFRKPDGGFYKIPEGYVGEVPAWIKDTEYYKGCVADGLIAESESKKDSALEGAAAVAEVAEKKSRARAKAKAKEE